MIWSHHQQMTSPLLHKADIPVWKSFPMESETLQIPWVIYWIFRENFKSHYCLFKPRLFCIYSTLIYHLISSTKPFHLRYLVFYSPKDFYYKVMTSLPAKVILAPLKEVIRTRKIAKGIMQAADIYPEAYLIHIIIGTIQGMCLKCGKWFVFANKLI